MISLDIAGYRFQLRAAAVIAHDNFVLLHRLVGDDYWSLPGGRVEPGEDAQTTLEREMIEELNQQVECTELLYVAENFFEHAGKPNHEIGLYFRAELSPESAILDKTRSHIGIEGNKQLEFRWFHTEQLQQLELHPSFLRESLAQPVMDFKHIVQREL